MTNAVAMDQRPRGIRACVFDAYGTLFESLPRRSAALENLVKSRRV